MTPQDWPPLTTLGLGLCVLRAAFAFWADVKSLAHRFDADQDRRADRVSRDVRKRFSA